MNLHRFGKRNEHKIWLRRSIPNATMKNPRALYTGRQTHTCRFHTGGFTMGPQTRPTLLLTIFCRYCGKIGPAKFDRCLPAESSSPNNATRCEYICSHCRRVIGLNMNDIAAIPATPPTSAELVRPYTVTGSFLIGERLSHPSYPKTGLVVGKEGGSPACILVSFTSRKSGLKKLVENIVKA